jgi:arabinofuranosyltransferase
VAELKQDIRAGAGPRAATANPRAVHVSTDTTSPLLYPVLFLALLLMLLHFWQCDDAFISYRYAKNFAAGYGLRFNIDGGLPVEGYSNLLWVLVAALPEFLTIPAYLVMPYLSLLCALALIWRVHNTARVLFSHSAAIGAAILLAAFPPFLIWSSSGLETMPFALVIFLVFEQLFLHDRCNAYILYPATTALILIRAEGALWAIAFAAQALVFAPRARRRGATVIVGTLIVSALLALWRHSYYHELIPNAAVTKMGLSWPRLERGYCYIVVFALTFLSPLLSIGAFVCRFDNIRVRMLFIGFGAFYAYAVLAGGDYMSMGRFLVPAVAFQALLTVALLDAVARPRMFGCVSTPLPVCLAMVIAVVGYLPMWDVYVVPKETRARYHYRHNTKRFVNEEAHWRFMKANSRRWRLKGELLAEVSQPGDSLVEEAIGNVGYFSGLMIYDRLGLVTKLPKRFARGTLASPGHDVQAPIGFFLKDDPTFIYASVGRVITLKRLDKYRKYYPYAPTVRAIRYLDEPQWLLYFEKVDTREQYVEKWMSVTSELAKADSKTG